MATVIGKPTADHLNSDNPGDTIHGFGGDDTLSGGAGVSLFGEDDNDNLLAVDGFIYGGNGDDHIVVGGGGGYVLIDPGPGADVIEAPLSNGQGPGIPILN